MPFSDLHECFGGLAQLGHNRVGTSGLDGAGGDRDGNLRNLRTRLVLVSVPPPRALMSGKGRQRQPSSCFQPCIPAADSVALPLLLASQLAFLPPGLTFGFNVRAALVASHTLASRRRRTEPGSHSASVPEARSETAGSELSVAGVMVAPTCVSLRSALDPREGGDDGPTGLTGPTGGGRPAPNVRARLDRRRQRSPELPPSFLSGRSTISPSLLISRSASIFSRLLSNPKHRTTIPLRVLFHVLGGCVLDLEHLLLPALGPALPFSIARPPLDWGRGVSGFDRGRLD